MAPDKRGTPLTATERQVLALLGEGKANKAIAHELGVRIGTVKVHLKSIFKRLGVQTRVQAALVARDVLAAAA